jgi:hypothetical protein
MGIPNMSLPELRPVQTENPMDQYAKALQIRQMGQQSQLTALQTQQQQIALKDQQAMTQAMHDWDGKDINALIPLTVKYGASANAVMGLKSKVLEQQEKYSAIAKDDAETGAKNLETMKGKNDMMVGALNTVMGAKDEELVPSMQSTAADLVQRGLLDPQHAQQLQQYAQLPPAQLRDKLKTFEKSYMSDTQQIEQATKEATTATQQAELPGKVADSAIKTAEAEQMKQGALPQNLADMKYRTLQQSLASGQPIGAGDKAFIKAYEKQKLLVPTASANIRVEGMMNAREYPVFDKKSGSTIMATPEEINRASRDEPGRYTAPSYTPEAVGAKDTTSYFTKGKGGQQLTAFNTAITHLDTLDRLAADLQNTDIRVVNKAKQEWATQTGGAAPANFDAAKNAMSGEVAAALKASGATDQEIAHVSATFDKAQSPAQLKGSINTYRELLKSKEVQLKKQYDAGMQGKPAFEQPQAGKISVTAPDGSVHPFATQAQADAFKKLAGIK